MHISESPILQISRFYSGLITFRNPLIVPIKQFGRKVVELYDALISGQNMEITNTLTLKRRAGYLAYNSNVMTGIPLSFYSFKPSSFPGTVNPVIDATDKVVYLPSGSTAPTTLVTKSTSDQTNFSGIGPYLYMGNPKFSQKWDGPSGTQGVTNWGIAIGSVNTASGPNTAGAGSSSGPSSHAWVNPGNVASAVSFATASTAPPPPILNNATQFLNATTFGFSIPATNTINGISVTFDVQVSDPPNGNLAVQMLKAGSAVGGAKTYTASVNTVQTITLGGSADLWGTTWTYNDINQTTFGVNFIGNDATNACNWSIRNVKITVFGFGGPAVSLVAGTLSAQNGFQYVFCYGNSVSGHVSSPTPVSANTGAFAGPNGVQVSLTASTDPQVNQIRVFRTTDGGGQPFFELPTSPYPNTTANITDNAPDNTLQIANIAPLPHFNDPPPAGLVDPVWYAGRLWGHVGNLLYFASGPDVTMGNGQESWFPVYVFALPTTIIRKFPTPNGMIISTVDDLYIVRGIDTTSFTVNEFMRDIGMRNWNAADSDGSNIYMYTNDRQMLLLNANGLQSISSSISDVVANVDPSAAYVSILRYTARNTFLFLGDGTTNIYPFNLSQEAWCPVQVPSGGARALGTIEIQPGVWAFLRGKTSTNQTIAQRDINTFSDEGTLYSCSAVFGPIPVADMLTLAQVKNIAVATAANGSTLTLSVLPNEVSATGTVNYQQLSIETSEPPELSATPSTSFTANRYTWMATPYSEYVNFFFMQMVWPAASTADELLAWAVGGTQTTGGSSLGQPGQLPQLQGR